MTVKELLSRMDSSELAEWMAFNEVEPFGQDFFRTGIICSTLVNLKLNKGVKPFIPSDFVPCRVKEEKKKIEKQDVKDMRDSLLTLVDKKDKRGKKKWET